MSSDSTSIGDRFKAYEAETRAVLPARRPMILRLDGRGFHSFTRGMDRPFSAVLADAIDHAAAVLCAEISGTVIGYTQSDEISLVVTADGKENTQPWFGGGIQKIVSVAASIVTGAFSQRIGRLAQFDARAFTVPDLAEAANYLIWRQRDAIRNSISMAAQAQFSHNQLHRKSTKDMLGMLAEAGIDWDAYDDRFRYGGRLVKITEQQEVSYIDKRSGLTVTTDALRSRWEITPAPHWSFAALAEFFGIGHLTQLDQNERTQQ